MNNFIRKVLALYKTAGTRTFAVGLLSISLAVTVYTLSVMTHAVYIRDGDQLTLAFTTKQQPDEILREKGIVTMAYDSVDFSGFSGKVGEIKIKRAFPITLSSDGLETPLMVTGGTVEEMLRTHNALPDGDDLVNLSMGMFLAPGDHVVVQRVESSLVDTHQEIPFETITRETCLIKNGRTRLLQQGETGQKVLTYAQTTVDGAVSEEELIGEDISKYPTDHIVLKGTGAAISDLDFGYSLDGNGKPTQYKRVLTNQVATGYSAGKGAWGASGMHLFYGYVAVDPAEIPYGSKLYIASPDGSFVYGYAIAADTGVGLLAGVIDVDLYYETYLESCLNGRRMVDIYVLE